MTKDELLERIDRIAVHVPEDWDGWEAVDARLALAWRQLADSVLAGTADAAPAEVRPGDGIKTHERRKATDAERGAVYAKLGELPRSAADLAQLTGLPVAVVSSALRRMIKEGNVEQHGAKRGAKYARVVVGEDGAP